MARAGSTKDVNTLDQLDRIEDNLTRRFRSTQGGGFKRDCLESFGDTNTGDPQILYDFVNRKRISGRPPQRTTRSRSESWMKDWNREKREGNPEKIGAAFLSASFS